MDQYSVRLAVPGDAAQIADIYKPYVLETAISFEEAVVDTDEMTSRIKKVLAAGLPWLVAEERGRVLGYAYATKWRERHAYRFTVECTAYVASGLARRGIGTALYGAMFPLLKEAGYHAVIAVIALPNAGSVSLHERFGMKKVAHFPQVGFKLGRWHDVGNWHLLLQSDSWPVA